MVTKINKLEITQAATNQIALILENDFTLTDHLFRLKIDGKGCDGFSYSTGFSKKLDSDKNIKLNNIEILMDPFTYFYCKAGLIDYQFVPSQNQEGFTFTNYNEHLHSGKFFKDESFVPTPEDLK